jgi:extracellular elastinolytic metalloproteinase
MSGRLLIFLLLILTCFTYISAQFPVSIDVEPLVREEGRIARLQESDFDDFIITHAHVSSVSNIEHIYLNQRYQGIQVKNSVMSLHLSNDGVPVQTHNQFFREIAGRINTTSPGLSREEAIAAAASHFNLDFQEELRLIEDSGDPDAYAIYNGADLSLEDIPLRLKYQQTEDGALRLAWDLSILLFDQSAWYSVRVDALDGTVLDVENWTLTCQFDHPHELSSCSNVTENRVKPYDFLSFRQMASSLQNAYRVYPLGVESPSHGLRELVVDPADPIASPYGWHDTNGQPGAEFTITRGNNVLAQEDIDGNNNTPGYRPNGGSNLVFDFPLDFEEHPHDNQDACITNLFYWNNITHDVIYHYGFTEAAGNFQQNNYGRGGRADDYVFADAMDGSGTNNANFSTPPDGSRPRMQMFLWTIGTNNTNFTALSPPQIRGTYNMAKAEFGPEVYNLAAEAVLANDGSGNPTFACQPLVNANEIAGKIALVDRGSCEFGLKCLNAQNAGAVAVVVCNNVGGNPFEMPPGASGNQVTIPSIMISQAACNTIKAQLSQGVTLSFKSNNGVPWDSDFDNGVILHEYGHGISIRLTGGAGTSSCLNNQEQMGEGWSDYYGLMLTMKESDIGPMRRGIGTFVLGASPNATGIRSFPYSTNMTTNPHTYSNITNLSVPHGVGSVWCAMLWEMTWALIDEYGFDPDFYYGSGGNNIALALVTEALKLQPCNPGFVDGRDAILLADRIMYNGAHQCLIWKAFAKRGLGFSADQGSPFDRSDGTQAFDLPDNCLIDFDMFADKDYVSPGDTIAYQIKALNTSDDVLPQVLISNAIMDITDFVIESVDPDAIIQNKNIRFPQQNLPAQDSIIRNYSVSVDENASLELYQFIDGAEVVNNNWKSISSPTQQDVWSRTTQNPRSGSFSWYARNNNYRSNQFLIMDTIRILGPNAEFSFWHSYNVENNWDGGLVEITTDMGRTWLDLGPYMTQNPYNGYIDNVPANQAFSGNSNGYIQTKVDLTDFEGALISIRFRMYSDATIRVDGWHVDDILLTQLEPGVSFRAEMNSPYPIQKRTIRKAPIRLVPCTTVYSTEPFSGGSLRRAIECANPGDTIRFAPPVFNKLLITDPETIVLDKNLVIYNNTGQLIQVNTDSDGPVFEILEGVHIVMQGLDIFTREGEDARGILNWGNLTLRDCKIFDLSGATSGSTIINEGTLTIEGTSNVMKD